MAKNQQVADPKQQDKPKPLVLLRSQMDARQGEFANALPAHIPVERFKRVVMTAVQNNPDLLDVDRQSFFNSCMKAAQDGLLPDGREGAIVIFSQKAQWMPMIAGILKKVRNSGELTTISAYVAHEKDHFVYVLGDEERIEHRPALGDRGKPIAAYAIAKTRDGGIWREVMTFAEIEQVRSVSRAKNSGPWTQWWGEMARKTVLRRLTKRLPMSSDLDDLIRRDDALYDLNSAGDGEQRAPRLRGAAALDALAASRTINALPAPPADEIEDAKVTGATEPRTGRRDDRSADAKEDGRGGQERGRSATQQPSGRAEAQGDQQDQSDGEGGEGDDDRLPGDDASSGSSDDVPEDGDDDAEDELRRLLDEIGETPKGIDPDDIDQVYAFREGMIAAERGVARKAIPGPLRAESRATESAAWQAGHDLSSARKRASKEG